MMTTQNAKMVLTHHAEAEIFLSADGAFVLTVLADGTALRLPRERYDHLARSGRRAWVRRTILALYWALRFASLTGVWHLR